MKQHSVHDILQKNNRIQNSEDENDSKQYNRYIYVHINII